MVARVPMMAQEVRSDIRKLIVDDLFLLDKFRPEILKQNVLYVIDGDTIKDWKSNQNSFQKVANSYVEIYVVDSIPNFYRIDVVFNLAFADFSIQEDTFKYFIYDRLGELIKVDGFVVSDILKLSHKEISILNEFKMFYPKWKKIAKLHKQKSLRIINILSISIIDALNQKNRNRLVSYPIINVNRN